MTLTNTGPHHRLSAGTASSEYLSPDGMAADLEHLAQVAATVLDSHVNELGRCAACGHTFPCELAMLAEHNMALL
jgi:hypothetical protein